MLTQNQLTEYKAFAIAHGHNITVINTVIKKIKDGKKLTEKGQQSVDQFLASLNEPVNEPVTNEPVTNEPVTNEPVTNENQRNKFIVDFDTLNKGILEYYLTYERNIDEVNNQIFVDYGFYLTNDEMSDFKEKMKSDDEMSNYKVKTKSNDTQKIKKITKNYSVEVFKNADFSEKFESVKQVAFKLDKTINTVKSIIDEDNHVLTLTVLSGKKSVKSLEIKVDFVNNLFTPTYYTNGVIESNYVLNSLRTMIKDVNTAIRMIKEGYNPSDVIAIWLTSLKGKVSLIDHENQLKDYQIPLSNLVKLLNTAKPYFVQWESIDKMSKYWLESVNELNAFITENGINDQMTLADIA